MRMEIREGVKPMGNLSVCIISFTVFKSRRLKWAGLIGRMKEG